MKPRMNAQLFGCSWAGVTLILVRSSFRKLNNGRRRKIFFKNDSIKITKRTLRIRGLIRTNGPVLPTWDYPKKSITFFAKLQSLFLKATIRSQVYMEVSSKKAGGA